MKERPTTDAVVRRVDRVNRGETFKKVALSRESSSTETTVNDSISSDRRRTVLSAEHGAQRANARTKDDRIR